MYHNKPVSREGWRIFLNGNTGSSPRSKTDDRECFARTVIKKIHVAFIPGLYKAIAYAEHHGTLHCADTTGNHCSLEDSNVWPMWCGLTSGGKEIPQGGSFYRKKILAPTIGFINCSLFSVSWPHSGPMKFLISKTTSAFVSMCEMMYRVGPPVRYCRCPWGWAPKRR